MNQIKDFFEYIFNAFKIWIIIQQWEQGLPTRDGSQVLSNVLIQGLVANIHMAHEKGFRDSAEHLRWIISELERGFVTVANVEQSKFK